MNDRQPNTRRRRQRVWTALLLFAVAALGASLAWRWRQSGIAAPAVPTVIVMPLHAAGARHDEGVLADGLSTELIGELAQITGLRTIASTSAQRADSDHLGPAQLARRVGATLALEGELRASGGDQIDVVVRLLALPGGQVQWSQTYDRKLADIVALQREIAQGVAATLALPMAVDHGRATPVSPQHWREYFEAWQLIRSPQRARGVDLLRALVAKAPDFARAQATLARTLTNSLRAGTAKNAELEEASDAAARALQLDPELAETQTALATLACRGGDWANCFDSFRRALALDPNDAECRISYAFWLAALGYVDRGLSEVERASLTDPLSYNANFSHARLLDTVGRHQEAKPYLDNLSAETGGLIYAKWHNAVWRHDYQAAAQLSAQMPRGDGFRESYTMVSEALAEPRLWPQVLPLIATSERANGGINVQRIMMPNPDYAIVIRGLEKMLRDGWPSYYLLLWMPEYAAMRRDAAFQDFLKRTGIVEYWRSNGFPPQCHADGDRALCN